MSFLDDVMGQPTAVEDTLAQLTGDASLIGSLGQLRHFHDTIVLTGMGNSLAALYPTHLRLLQAGLPAVWIEAGELFHYASDGLGEKTLVVMVSQSGESIEITRLLDKLSGKVSVLGITNEPNSALAKRAETPLVMKAGKEGIVATRTYVATLATLALLTGALTNTVEEELKKVRRATLAMKELLGRKEAITRTLVGTLGNRPRQLWTIARGPSLASAMGGALVMKEASHTAAEALSGGQFRHGPLEMVEAGHAALLFSPAGRGAMMVRRLGDDIAQYGGKVVVVGPKDDRLPGANLPLVETDKVDESVAPLVEIVAVELFADAVATARGHKAGEFKRMGKVTREE
jgi:glucosamine--fructose-6-phosphate aminotransferase (isomerizing)